MSKTKLIARLLISPLLVLVAIAAYLWFSEREQAFAEVWKIVWEG